MATHRIRVWVEEVEPPTKLSFTWTPADDAEPQDAGEIADLVYSALRDADGVLHAEPQDDGVLVDIDPELTTRYDLATVIRHAVDPEHKAQKESDVQIRVWAEDLTASRMRITWFDRDSGVEAPEPPERRKVAAWLIVQDGVRAARPDPEGVVVRYDPERLDRGAVRDTVRSAVRSTSPLRERSDQLLKRAPSYGNLARKLAMDDRISPLPGAARQAAHSRMAGGGRSTAMSTAARFIPGAALISRIHTLAPMLTELSQWSRESDPEIVEEHLGSVGLDRDTLRSDTITAHEIRMFAQESASEKTAELGVKASEGARHAISAGRDFLSQMRASMQADTGRTTAPRDELLDEEDEVAEGSREG